MKSNTYIYYMGKYLKKNIPKICPHETGLLGQILPWGIFYTKVY